MNLHFHKVLFRIECSRYSMQSSWIVVVIAH